jgi:SNF2 family DNA or RNA helicase
VSPVASLTSLVEQRIPRGQLSHPGDWHAPGNNLGEVWSIMDWCSPGLLGPRLQFLARYAKATPAIATALRDALAPFLVRRLKSDPAIGLDLPPKTERTHIVDLSNAQRVVLEALLRDTTDQLTVAAPRPSAHGRVRLNLISAQQQVCNSPGFYQKAPATDIQELLADCAGSGGFVWPRQGGLTWPHLKIRSPHPGS